MMIVESEIAAARAHALEAARWLRLVGIKAHSAASAFSPRTSTYHELFDPDVDPVRLKNACRCLLDLVERQLVVEQLEADRLWSRRDSLDDPYKLERRVTLQGAVLTDVRRMLGAALALLGEDFSDSELGTI